MCVVNFEVSSCTKFYPAAELTAPPDSLAGGEGQGAPPQESHPALGPSEWPRVSALRASGFGRSFIALPMREKISLPKNKFGSTPLLYSTEHTARKKLQRGRGAYNVDLVTVSLVKG